MKKSELKTGMVVEQRNGSRGLVLLGTQQKEGRYATHGGDIIGGCGDYMNCWSELDCYRDDLTHNKSTSCEDFDIVRVYIPENNSKAGSVNPKDLQLLWERQEIALKLNDNYEAKVNLTSNTISVGCQTIPIDKVKQLYNLIEEAQERKQD